MSLCRFLGYIDKIGSAYEEESVATGYGAYIARVKAISILLWSWDYRKYDNAF